MEILAEKILKFHVDINQQEWLDLVEKVSETYPFAEVERRPHLTMMLPNFISESDSKEAIELRSNFFKKVFIPIQQYMSTYGIDNMEFKKNFITVSKLVDGGMGAHKDDKKQTKDNFICMLYLNDNYEGAELFFTDFDISYKPKAGDILIYQAKFRHGVTGITSGNRYSIGTGFKGPIKD
jgi:hypothetical protein